MGGDGLGERQAGGHQEGGPVDAVEADDLLAYEVEVAGQYFSNWAMSAGSSLP